MTGATGTAYNQFEDKARRAKVAMLCRYLADEFLKVLADLPEDHWEHAAAKAGVNKPSRDSQLLCIEILKGKLR